MRRLSVSFSLVILVSSVMVTPALAAAPANDTWAGRAAIGAIPFSTTQDTTEATTDADDDEANTCGAPAMDASVWYELSGVSGDILVDVSGSDYAAGVFVLVGSPGSFEVVACAPGAVVFTADPSVAYSILAIDDGSDGGGNGGSLSLVVDVAPPPPTVDLNVDGSARFDSRTGVATVSGTATCDGTDFGFVELMLEQRVGRFIVRGFGFAEFPCTGSAEAWTAEVVGDTGLFKGGKGSLQAFASACNEISCGDDFVEATVQLRNRR